MSFKPDDEDPRIKPLMDKIKAIAQNENFVLNAKMSAVGEQLKAAAFINDGIAVAAIRERYHGLVDEKLDGLQSYAAIMKQMMDIAAEG